MKTLIRTSILLIVFSSFFSCISQRPISQLPPANNESYRVDYLFEHEGCKVYRFFDRGHYVYFTNCNSDVTSIENDSTQIRMVNRVKKQ